MAEWVVIRCIEEYGEQVLSDRVFGPFSTEAKARAFAKAAYESENKPWNYDIGHDRYDADCDCPKCKPDEPPVDEHGLSGDGSVVKFLPMRLCGTRVPRG